MSSGACFEGLPYFVSIQEDIIIFLLSNQTLTILVTVDNKFVVSSNIEQMTTAKGFWTSLHCVLVNVRHLIDSKVFILKCQMNM